MEGALSEGWCTKKKLVHNPNVVTELDRANIAERKSNGDGIRV